MVIQDFLDIVVLVVIVEYQAIQELLDIVVVVVILEQEQAVTQAIQDFQVTQVFLDLADIQEYQGIVE